MVTLLAGVLPVGQGRGQLCLSQPSPAPSPRGSPRPMGVAQHSWALGRAERAGDPTVLRNGWGPGRADGLAGSAQGGQWWPGGPGGHGSRTWASPAPSPSGAGRASPAPWGPGSASDPQTLHLSFPGLWAQQGEPPAWAPGRHRPPSRGEGLGARSLPRSGPRRSPASVPGACEHRSELGRAGRQQASGGPGVAGEAGDRQGTEK